MGNKERFIELLKSTGREGVDTVITNLEKLGFFEAPASTRFHLSRTGGLLEHSLNVCKMALMLSNQVVALKPELKSCLPEQSIVLVALLHDICKAEIYKEGTRNVKNKNTNQWEQVPVFETDYSHLPLGHGEKSVIRLLTWGVKLNQDEMLAIRWHMGPWALPFQSYEDMGNLNAAKDKCPLLNILSAADGLASNILEVENKQ